MTRFEWTTDLETGNATIDEQHRSLFALSNALNDAIDSGEADEETVADCVWRLADYVVEHFADEQDLMESSLYPNRSVHASLHDGFTGDVLRITARFMNEDDVSAAELGPLVTRWLREHIATADKRFVTYLEELD